MWIKVKSGLNGSAGARAKSGEVVEVDSDTAQDMIKAGTATPAQQPTERATAPHASSEARVKTKKTKKRSAKK